MKLYKTSSVRVKLQSDLVMLKSYRYESGEVGSEEKVIHDHIELI